MIGDIERHAFRLPCDAGMAGRAPEFRHQGRSRDLPRESVFAAAGTEQEDVHRGLRMRGFARRGGGTNRGEAQGGVASPSPSFRGVRSPSTFSPCRIRYRPLMEFDAPVEMASR